jgi:hypothetical protein
MSLLAWPVLKLAVNDFLTISDDPIGPLMRRLAREESIVAGESAVAGLAGLIEACKNKDLCAQLELLPTSRVLVFGTAGATDPEVYHQLNGTGWWENQLVWQIFRFTACKRSAGTHANTPVPFAPTRRNNTALLIPIGHQALQLIAVLAHTGHLHMLTFVWPHSRY